MTSEPKLARVKHPVHSLDGTKVEVIGYDERGRAICRLPRAIGCYREGAIVKLGPEHVIFDEAK